MAQPSLTTITVDGAKFNAVGTSFSLLTPHDGTGMPQMGALHTAIEAHVDMHDTRNLPFSTLQQLFQMANIVTRDKIKTIKIEYWADENREDALATFTFQGWISHFNITSGGGANHVLVLQFQPALDAKQFVDIRIGN
jgi:hypothetical protein